MAPTMFFILFYNDDSSPTADSCNVTLMMTMTRKDSVLKPEKDRHGTRCCCSNPNTDELMITFISVSYTHLTLPTMAVV